MPTISDYFNNAYNSGNPNVASVTGTRSMGGTSLTCDDLTGWPTSTPVHFSTYQVDTDNVVVPGTQTDWKGVVSGSTISSLTYKAGAADSGNAIGDKVEMNPTGAWVDDLVTGILSHADQDGGLKDGAVDNAGVLASNVVTAAKLADGAVTAAKMGDSSWTTVTFQNSYVAQNSSTVRYRKIANRVHLQGQPGKTTLDANTMFTLPSGYRPTQALIYAVPGAGSNMGKFVVNTDGTCLLGNVPASGAYVGIDTVSFLVD